jgi:hypothetical protein
MATIALTLGAAVVIGVVTVVLPLAGAIVMIVVGLLLIGLVLLRRGFSAAGVPAAATASSAGPSSTRICSSTDLRWCRLLFYLGTLTIAQASAGSALGLTVSELFFLAALAGVAFAVLRGHDVAAVPMSLVAGVVLFGAGGALSSLAAQSPAASGAEILHGAYVMLAWAWVGAMVLRTREHFLIAMTLWVMAAALDGAGAIMQAAGADFLTGPLEGGRATGFADHPNDLGGTGAVALVPSLLLATRWNGSGNAAIGLSRWLLVAMVAAAIVLSASVAGMLAGLAGLMVWLCLPSVRVPSRVAAIAALASSLLVLAMAGGSITSPGERVQQVTAAQGADSGAGGSGQDRIAIAKAAWPKIKADPLIGAGLDSHGQAVTILSSGQSIAYQVHGAPLAAWYEAGLLGLFGLVLVWWAILSNGWGSLGSTDLDEMSIGGALLAAFVAFLVFAMTVPFVFQQYGWFSAVVLVAWSAHRRRSARAQDLPPAASRARPVGRWQSGTAASGLALTPR